VTRVQIAPELLVYVGGFINLVTSLINLVIAILFKEVALAITFGCTFIGSLFVFWFITAVSGKTSEYYEE